MAGGGLRPVCWRRRSGESAEAEAILEETVEAPVVRVEPRLANVDGVRTQRRYKAEVTDKMELIRYVATHPEWTGLLDPNMPALNGLARSQREALSIPGVKAVAHDTKAVSA